MSEYYPWPRNEFKIKDPETSAYSGNVIGNMPKEEKISAIFATGNESLSAINELGGALNEQVADRAVKFTALWSIVDSVNSAIESYFGD